MPRKASNPDQPQLYQTAAIQGGYFTARQAREAGYTWQNLSYHGRAGRFERVARGLYRLREFPSVPYEDVLAAWLQVGSDRAVVSHETALVLHDLVPARPRKIDLTVLRAFRPHGDRTRPVGVRIHTTTRPFRPDEVVTLHGVRLTATTRSILDAAKAGTEPDYITQAVAQALDRRLLTPQELLTAADNRSARVRQIIVRALEDAHRARVP